MWPWSHFTFKCWLWSAELRQLLGFLRGFLYRVFVKYPVGNINLLYSLGKLEYLSLGNFCYLTMRHLVCNTKIWGQGVVEVHYLLLSWLMLDSGESIHCGPNKRENDMFGLALVWPYKQKSLSRVLNVAYRHWIIVFYSLVLIFSAEALRKRQRNEISFEKLGGWFFMPLICYLYLWERQPCYLSMRWGNIKLWKLT